MPRAKNRKTPGPKGWNLVWEDDAVAVVHKGPGLLSVPDQTENPALSDLLPRFLQERDGPRATAYPLHRLDRAVSGLLLFAKTPVARDFLRAEFEAGRPERRYQAVVRGRLRLPKGTFRSFLDTKAARPKSVSADRGVPAVTHFSTVAEGDGYTLVEVRLETGRKNQIRAHFAEAGHPLLGDREFGGPEILGFDRRRIALHAGKFSFRHPADQRWIEIDDPAPASFSRLMPSAPRKEPARKP